jgi:hypothetical protein
MIIPSWPIDCEGFEKGACPYFSSYKFLCIQLLVN